VPNNRCRARIIHTITMYSKVGSYNKHFAMLNFSDLEAVLICGTVLMGEWVLICGSIRYTQEDARRTCVRNGYRKKASTKCDFRAERNE
jgi:hypothetical protein